jgi:hypothetical protein
VEGQRATTHRSNASFILRRRRRKFLGLLAHRAHAGAHLGGAGLGRLWAGQRFADGRDAPPQHRRSEAPHFFERCRSPLSAAVIESHIHRMPVTFIDPAEATVAALRESGTVTATPRAASATLSVVPTSAAAA